MKRSHGAWLPHIKAATKVRATRQDAGAKSKKCLTFVVQSVTLLSDLLVLHGHGQQRRRHIEW
jgi:hypothetical protein